MWSCGENENTLIHTPHHKSFLWSCGEFYYKNVYQNYFSSYIENSCGESCGLVVKMKIFYTHPHHKIFLWSCSEFYYKNIYQNNFVPRLKTLVVNLVVFWWKWKYSILHPTKRFSHGLVVNSITKIYMKSIIIYIFIYLYIYIFVYLYIYIFIYL